MGFAPGGTEHPGGGDAVTGVGGTSGGLGLLRPAALSPSRYPNSPSSDKAQPCVSLLLANLHNHSLPVFLCKPNLSPGFLKSASHNALDSITHTHDSVCPQIIGRHGKHAQTERKDTLFNRESEGPGAEVQTRQSRARLIQALPEHEDTCIAE